MDASDVEHVSGYQSIIFHLHTIAGVRNSVGMDFYPDSDHLYFTDNGRDSLSDNIPDCELNVLTQEGQNFGFPYCLSVGKGNPWKRALGPGTSINDPEMNANGSVINCTGELP